MSLPGDGLETHPANYYGRPILKAPVWKWPIPAYFFTGGLAGGSSLLAFGARVTGRAGVARRGRRTALVALVVSAGLLIEDLGRPSRFANMLRMAKVTSPMSVGSWILSAFGPVVAAGVAADALGTGSGVGAVADAVASGLGALVATYTGVLVADSAVPAWHEARGHLPALFAAGAAASAGACAVLVAPAAEAVGGALDPARRLALAGVVGELAATEAMERHLGELAEPYREGRAGRLARAAKVMAGAGLGLLWLGGARRKRPRLAVVVEKAGAALVLGGAACTRFAVVEAGRQSAADPKYVVGPQRARLAARSGAA